ncbi:MAG TPA: lysylphosphatidylglycerol synthase transmembrane domain-containing protein [Vicinamibacteria bacterium]|nr:lysylphosphatidylglycerol synthase transmembrane domain-containing protein [Vicinamibacteria bacterium]
MKRLLRHLSQVLPALLALGCGAYVMRSADLGRVAREVSGLGWRLPLLLVPFFLITLLEGVAWWRSFSLLGGRPRFGSLIRVRLATEALMLGLPSGALISESVQPVLLTRRCGLPLETAVVASVGRKFFVVVSHGIVLALVTFMAWPVLDAASHTAIGRGGLPWALLGAAALLIGTFGVAIAAGARAQLAERLRRVLQRLLGRWLGGWLQRHAAGFERTDQQLLKFFQKERGSLVAPMLIYVAGWFARGLETLVYLHLLGVHVSLTAATVIETALVLVRSAAIPIPAGLGVQDALYVFSLQALGVPDAVTAGTALVLLKRGRDLFWVTVGFLLLNLVGRGRPLQAAETGRASVAEEASDRVAEAPWARGEGGARDGALSRTPGDRPTWSAGRRRSS